MESGAMISQRRTAQFGLLAAAAVLVTSIGILVSNAGDTSQASSAKSIGSDSRQTQTRSPMTLSASADSSTTVAVQR
jgi:hypothetical protein